MEVEGEAEDVIAIKDEAETELVEVVAFVDMTVVVVVGVSPGLERLMVCCLGTACNEFARQVPIARASAMA